MGVTDVTDVTAATDVAEVTEVTDVAEVTEVTDVAAGWARDPLYLRI